jgi:hypothetical protein
MAVGILKYPIRKFRPYYGNLLYLPLREMSVGTSPNLLSWNGASPSTGWSSSKVTLSDEVTPAPPVSAKCLKTLCNDAGGTGSSYAYKAVANHANYKGITAILKCYCQAPPTNGLNSAWSSINDGVSEGDTKVTVADSWALYTTIKKISSNATTLQVFQIAKYVSTASTTDILYSDYPVFIVPQSISRDRYARLIHPEGAYNNGQGFYFDGVDDLITTESDFIGTSACTIMEWIKPAFTGYSGQRLVDNGKTYFWLSLNVTWYLSFTSNALNVATSVNPSISLGTWQHICITRTTNGIANFYINGVLSGSANQDSGTPVGGTTNVIIGNRLAGDKSFAGSIDDLQVYNRVLNLSEIQQHYSMTKGGH